MEKQIKRLADSQVDIQVDVPWDEFLSYQEKAFDQLSNNLTVKGFRTGKAPKEIAEKELGKEKVLALAADNAIKDFYKKIIKEENLEPVGLPSVDILKLAENNLFSFKIKIEVLSDIKLPDIKKIAESIELKKIAVDEKEFNNTLEWIRRSRANFKDLDRGAKEGDFVSIEYQSDKIENNKLFKDAFVLGKSSLVKGFEENLISMKTGDIKEFHIVFPEDYHKKELQKVEVAFKTEMKKVQEMILPDLTDDFAKSLGAFDSLAILKKNVKDGMEKEQEMKDRAKWRGKVLEEIVKDTDISVPKSLLILEKERLLKETEKEISDIDTVVEKRVKGFLVLRQVGKENSIKVKEEEITQAINSFLTNYPQEEGKEIDQERLKGYYESVIHDEKVFQIIDSYANHSNNN